MRPHGCPTGPLPSAAAAKPSAWSELLFLPAQGLLATLTACLTWGAPCPPPVVQRLLSLNATDFTCGVEYTFYAWAWTGFGPSATFASYDASWTTNAGNLEDQCGPGGVSCCAAGLACANASSTMLCAGPPGPPDSVVVQAGPEDTGSVYVTVTPPADRGAVGVGERGSRGVARRLPRVSVGRRGSSTSCHVWSVSGERDGGQHTLAPTCPPPTHPAHPASAQTSQGTAWSPNPPTSRATSPSPPSAWTLAATM